MSSPTSDVPFPEPPAVRSVQPLVQPDWTTVGPGDAGGRGRSRVRTPVCPGDSRRLV